jgi:hypothetical protein
MNEGEFRKRAKSVDLIRGETPNWLDWLDEARKEWPTEESVIVKNPKYWADLEGMSQYAIILRNNVDAERDQWFLKWLGDIAQKE